MKRLAAILALILATSLYLIISTSVCTFTYSILKLNEATGINLNFGHWLAIVIIIKTLFIDSQAFSSNDN
jgi:hypothetical protein